MAPYSQPSIPCSLKTRTDKHSLLVVLPPSHPRVGVHAVDQVVHLRVVLPPVALVGLRNKNCHCHKEEEQAEEQDGEQGCRIYHLSGQSRSCYICNAVPLPHSLITMAGWSDGSRSCGPRGLLDLWWPGAWGVWLRHGG